MGDLGFKVEVHVGTGVIVYDTGEVRPAGQVELRLHARIKQLEERVDDLIRGKQRLQDENTELHRSVYVLDRAIESAATEATKGREQRIAGRTKRVLAGKEQVCDPDGGQEGLYAGEEESGG